MLYANQPVSIHWLSNLNIHCQVVCHKVFTSFKIPYRCPL